MKTDRSLSIPDLIASRREGWSLPQPFYTDPSIFRLEMERIFMRYWLFAGFMFQVSKPGDYFTYQFGDESLVIIRDDDGQLGAFSNVCRHRGSLVCLQHSGHVKSLVCPYHQWVYARDGTLLAAKHLPGELDKAQFGLRRAHLRTIEGIIFVSFAENPPSFDEVERDCARHLKPQGLQQARICHTRRYDVSANWKLIVENSRECYHCPAGHPEFCRIMPTGDDVSQSPRLVAEHKALFADAEARWKSLGLETRRIRELWYTCGRRPMRKGFVSESLDGKAVAPLMGSYPDRDVGSVGCFIQPGFMYESSGDHAVVLAFQPVGPTLTKIDVHWLVHEKAKEGVDYRVEAVTAFWRATGEQDWKLCENNQAGVNSRCYEPGPYVSDEEPIEEFIQWYFGEIIGK